MRHTHIVADEVPANVTRVRARIADAAARAGRMLAAPEFADSEDADTVEIVAAAKYVDAATVELLVKAGVTAIGENRLDQLLERRRELGATAQQVRWHYIGRLQSRKVRDLLGQVDWIHTLCSDSSATQLAARHGDEEAAMPRLLVQVNTAGDPAKDGLTPEQVAPFLEALPANLSACGLTTMPAEAARPEDSRRAFAALRELRDGLREQFEGRHELRHLSMGTTQDFEVAVEEGATLVRLGRVLYAAEK